MDRLVQSEQDTQHSHSQCLTLRFLVLIRTQTGQYQLFVSKSALKSANFGFKETICLALTMQVALRVPDQRATSIVSVVWSRDSQV